MPTRSDAGPTSHDRHDPLLVAALAAGDLAATDRVHATELIRTCSDCATLHGDLVAIARATATVPPPIASRPRDFRLTPEQAARLRPSGWRRLVGAFAGPRLAFMRPLGIGLTTIGLAGLLLGNISLGLGGSASTAAPVPQAASSGGGPTTESYNEGRGATGSGIDTAGEPLASSAPAASGYAAPAAVASAPAASAAPGLESQPSEQVTGTSNDGAGAAGGPKTSSPVPVVRDATGGPESTMAVSTAPDLRTMIFVAAVLIGLGLLVVRRVARRVTTA